MTDTNSKQIENAIITTVFFLLDINAKKEEQNPILFYTVQIKIAKHLLKTYF